MMDTKKIPKKLSQEVLDIASRCFTEGVPIHTLKNISKNDLNNLYVLAYSLYNRREYKMCNDIFKFLCLMDHYNPKYWLGLAHTRKLLGWYDSAINCFGMLFILEPNEPSYPIQAAECHLALHNLTAVVSAIDHANFLIQELPDNTYKNKLLQDISNVNKNLKKYEAINDKKSQKTQSE